MTKWMRKLKEALRWIKDFVNAIMDALNKIRADVARKLILGLIMKMGSLASIAETMGFDYENVLNKLDDLANVDLIPLVKLLVKDHPVQVVDDTFDEKAYAMPVSRNLAKKAYIPVIQLLIVTVRDLVTNEVYLVYIDAYVARKVAEIAKVMGQDLSFSTKIDMTLQVLERLRSEFNVVVVTFDSWYVNGRTPGYSETYSCNVVSSLKSNARVVGGGNSVLVGREESTTSRTSESSCS
ncbi:hypothetical protein SJAV_01390 [Sulfurisphaera javensis]|uniref:Uncharacterized protein n=1 Tax=Sulfurisphaera javensis TaxID=2049879 RepID=A0AAT9GMS9_9CREN